MNNTIFIFDFDGTIADTHHYIVEISNRLSRKFHYNTIAPGELERLKDKTSQEIIRHLEIPLMKIPAIIAMTKRELSKSIGSIKPISGLKETLPKIKNMGRQMGILSSNSSENVMKFLKNHSLDIFDFIHTTSKIWSKNTSLKKLIKKNGFQKDQILYICDEIRDIVAAKRLGVKVAAVTWGYNSSQALKKYNPDFLIHSPEDLFQLCKQTF